MTVGSTQPLTEMSRCVGLTTSPPSCADCREIWEPQTAGTLRATPGHTGPVMGLLYLYLYCQHADTCGVPGAVCYSTLTCAVCLLQHALGLRCGKQSPFCILYFMFRKASTLTNKFSSDTIKLYLLYTATCFDISGWVETCSCVLYIEFGCVCTVTDLSFVLLTAQRVDSR